jgi:TrmH family RNA methyltransferase
MEGTITSKDNKLVREVKQLTLKKFRDQLGRFLVEGPVLISEAINNDAEVKAVFYCDALLSGSDDGEDSSRALIQMLTKLDIPVYEVEHRLFLSLSDTVTPQGILAVVARREISSRTFFARDPSGSVIVLDRLQDPGNLGTILRTADAAGFLGVLILKGSGDIYAPKVVRATAGSLFRVPVLFTDTPEETLTLLREYEKKILCTSPKAEQAYFDIRMDDGVAIVIGNEASGACEAFVRQCDALVSIPMAGTVESLNAAISAGILMYESVRQKAQKL